MFLCFTDYMKLGALRKKLPNVPCVALTATATPHIVTDIINSLKVCMEILLMGDYVRFVAASARVQVQSQFLQK